MSKRSVLFFYDDLSLQECHDWMVGEQNHYRLQMWIWFVSYDFYEQVFILVNLFHPVCTEQIDSAR